MTIDLRCGGVSLRMAGSPENQQVEELLHALRACLPALGRYYVGDR